MLNRTSSMDRNYISDAIIIELEKPLKPFHSHHWFHIGEYYLAKPSRRELNVNNVVIIPPTRNFYSQITKVSGFFLLLSLPVYNLSRLVIVDPLFVPYKLLDKSGMIKNYSEYSVFEHGTHLSIDDIHSLWTYNKNYPEELQFQIIKNKSQYQFYINKSIIQAADVSLSFGHYPHHSTDWFSNHDDVDRNTVRRKIISFCQSTHFNRLLLERTTRIQFYHFNDIITEGSDSSWNQKDPNKTICKMVIYQRDVNRRFVHLETIIKNIFRSLQSRKDKYLSIEWKVAVIHHDESTHPCVLHHILKEADIYLTSHGFQSMGLFFLPDNALLFEVFPFRYFKSTYINLSKQYGLRHSWVQNQIPTFMSRQVLRIISQDICMNNRRCRSYARGDSIMMPNDHIESVIFAMIDIENRTYSK